MPCALSPSIDGEIPDPATADAAAFTVSMSFLVRLENVADIPRVPLHCELTPRVGRTELADGVQAGSTRHYAGSAIVSPRHAKRPKSTGGSVGPRGLEPRTSSLSGMRSNRTELWALRETDSTGVDKPWGSRARPTPGSTSSPSRELRSCRSPRRHHEPVPVLVAGSRRPVEFLLVDLDRVEPFEQRGDSAPVDGCDVFEGRP